MSRMRTYMSLLKIHRVFTAIRLTDMYPTSGDKLFASMTELFNDDTFYVPEDDFDCGNPNNFAKLPWDFDTIKKEAKELIRQYKIADVRFQGTGINSGKSFSKYAQSKAVLLLYYLLDYGQDTTVVDVICAKLPQGLMREEGFGNKPSGGRKGSRKGGMSTELTITTSSEENKYYTSMAKLNDKKVEGEELKIEEMKLDQMMKIEAMLAKKNISMDTATVLTKRLKKLQQELA